MSSPSVDWRGYWPAAPTPFTADGALDLDALGRMLALYLDHGVHGVLVHGTTGEWFAQSADERARVARAAVEAVGGRVPVVVGVTAFTAAEAAEHAVAAAAAGADGVLTTPPPYVHPTDDEVVAFYATVAAATELPLMVYNWPRGTAVDMSTELLVRLAELDRVAAVKDSTGDELKSYAALEALAGRVRFFARFVSPRGLALLRGLGGDGVIDGGGVGAVFAAPFFEAAWAGRTDEALALAARYRALMGALVDAGYGARHGSPTAQLKANMRLLGQPGGYVRPPLLDLTGPAVLADLAGVLEASGLVAELARRGSDPRALPHWPQP